MADILRTTFSNAFSWMKMHEFRLRFHWNLFPRVQLTKIPALVQMMAWRQSGDKPLSGQWWSVYWRIYASFGLNELSKIIKLQMINSLRPSEVICRRWCGSTLAQVMACYLMAPNHYLDRFWRITNKVSWHSPEAISEGNTEYIHQ